MSGGCVPPSGTSLIASRVPSQTPEDNVNERLDVLLQRFREVESCPVINRTAASMAFLD